jgi:retron-type reverse transcriptase
MSPVEQRTTQARKAHSLIGQVYDRRNLRRAWERVKKNKGAGGVDGVTIARFEEDLEHYLDVLHQQLKEGRYRPRPVKRVEIDKPGTTKKRPLGIPTVTSYREVVQRVSGFVGGHAPVPSVVRGAA